MNMPSDFLAPRGTAQTIDTFLVRGAILQAITEVLPRLSGTLLDVGSGYQPYRSLVTGPPGRVQRYIGLDLRGNIYQRPDLEWDGMAIPLRDGTIDCALATEVLEHCPEPERILREVWRVLRPGGLLFFTVPFLWPLHTVPYDEYRYTPFALERHVRAAGFAAIDLQAMGGWDRSLAQMIGLWARRRWRPHGEQRALLPRLWRAIGRRALPPLVLPLVHGLAALDTPPRAFSEQTMLTGIAGTASKAGQPAATPSE